jgi:hypothetical protein
MTEITFKDCSVDDKKRLIIADNGVAYPITKMLNKNGDFTDNFLDARSLIVKCAEDDWRVIDLSCFQIEQVQ